MKTACILILACLAVGMVTARPGRKQKLVLRLAREIKETEALLDMCLLSGTTTPAADFTESMTSDASQAATENESEATEQDDVTEADDDSTDNFDDFSSESGDMDKRSWSVDNDRDVPIGKVIRALQAELRAVKEELDECLGL